MHIVRYRVRRVLMLVAALVLASGAACSSDGAEPSPSPVSTGFGPHSEYARQLCPVQANLLDREIASMLRLSDGIESNSFEVKQAAGLTLVTELAEHQRPSADFLNSVAPPVGDESFVERMRINRQVFSDVLTEVLAAVQTATTSEEVAAAFELLIASFNEGFDGRSALAVASPELQAALRAEPSCAPLF